METEEQILERHKKERKDLQNQIMSLKKQSNKKQRKSVNDQCRDLEIQLDQKHQQELQLRDIENRTCDTKFIASNNHETETMSQLGEKQVFEPKKRRNRQKERIAKREAEIARIKQEAQIEADSQPDLKKIEQSSLDHICQINGLKQINILPDGHCLFSSILDQLKERHSNIPSKDYIFPTGYQGTKEIMEMDVYALRSISCWYVRENRNDFIPYLFDEVTSTIKDIDAYIESIEKTAQWGGEIELLSLSKVFQCCISVLMSGRSTLNINEDECKNPELKLVYYQHSYALGAHYNSLHDI